MDQIGSNPFLIPIVGTVFGTAMVVAIVGITFWFKARERELQMHRELRVLEMEHQRRMKEMEVEIEKARASAPPISKAS
jgi:uncharacterized membrane protein YciS (DUF1049 family)